MPSSLYAPCGRREALAYAVSLAAMAVLPRAGKHSWWGIARLNARPGTPQQPAIAGLAPLGLEPGRDGLLFVPASYQRDKPAPFLLALHGARGNAQSAMEGVRAAADARGFVVLAPDSRDGTWDAVRAGFGPDVAFIDRALQFAFDRCAIDPARVAVQGFSDGASYALGLGLPNGDLFRNVMSFSPGMVPASETPDHGKPRIFLSHGRQDPVLNIDRTSRVLSRGLRNDGFDVTYQEFDGVHTLPPDVLQQALDWWLPPATGQ